MIVVPCDQGDDAWKTARLGLPTASCFDKIITKARLTPAKNEYVYQLAAESQIQEPCVTSTSEESAWMQRGKELEPHTFAAYALVRDVDPEKVGFILHDSKRFGGSPDALVGDDGGLEIKSPNAA